MLKEYKRKRDFGETPEPGGEPSKRAKAGPKQALTYVIQKHAARRLHYDFRLEIDGVLVSWAVPKGPSLNPAEKRLAVMTEDHPLAYASFEGVIPEKQYGAGPVIIWDTGVYSPDDAGKLSWGNRQEAQDRMREGLRLGKLSFFLDGAKLKGCWTLVKLKNTEKDWLLIKHHDSYADASIEITETATSAVSGLTLDELDSGHKDPPRLGHLTELLKKGRQAKFPEEVAPMLATLADAPFKQNGWLFEAKLDGIRALSHIRANNVQINSRRGLDLTNKYPSLAKRLSSYKHELVIDGEIVALDEKGRPSFQHLQQRSGLRKHSDIDTAESALPIIYYVFDIVYLDGKDLRLLTLAERKEILKQSIVPSREVRLVDSLGEDGEAAFQACLEHGLEGIVGKRQDSIYESGRRSKNWLKIKSNLTAEFLICGYTAGSGSRLTTLGALILGEYDQRNKLVHVGSVGTGFNQKNLQSLLKLLAPLTVKTCPFEKRPPGKFKPTWVKPQLVAEIKYLERTKDNILRAPVFMHLREDIEPRKVKPPTIVHTTAFGPASEKQTRVKNINSGQVGGELNKNELSSHDTALIAGVSEQLASGKNNLILQVESHALSLTNLDKEMWPATKEAAAITKRDYIRYLAQVSPYLLPHLKDRLITLLRFPNGIYGGKFYQKHWERGRPDFVATVRSFTEHDNQDQDFLVCNNLATLLWLGQIADLELHTSHTRANPEPDGHHLPLTFGGSLENLQKSLLNYPDYLVFDLDPYLYSGKEKKGAEPELHRAGFQRACDLAFWLKELLDSLTITSYVKTSGRTGLHIYIPIIRRIDYDTVRALSEIIGRYVLQEHADAVTMDWAVVKRTGKVFLDHNMNARSKSLASLYSPRVAPEASVSTALSWDELRFVYPTDFTIRTIPERLRQVGDLWADILDHKNDLQKLLSRGSQVLSVPDLIQLNPEAANNMAERKERAAAQTNSRKQEKASKKQRNRGKP